MNRNKIVYGNETLIDLTSDTVTAADLAEGVTAHDRSGAPIVGTGMGGHTIQNASGTDMTARAGLQFKSGKVSDDSANDRTVVEQVVPLTEAQYQALPSSKESDNTFYFTTDGVTQPLPSLGYTPVGTIISVMGTSAPTNFLACNGQTVNIADYPVLANYFYEQFGQINKFGGDGTTTFGIPDLRGEFLRGTGTNSHSGQGSGAAVGTHQDATEIPVSLNVNGTDGTWQTNIYNATGWNGISNGDDTSRKSLGGVEFGSALGTIDRTNVNNVARATVRPTNTSVLYCIAVRDIYIGKDSALAGRVDAINERFNYSTAEKVVGKWYDGRNRYEKTVVVDADPVPSEGNTQFYTVDSDTTHQLIFYTGVIEYKSNNNRDVLPLVNIRANDGAVYTQGSVHYDTTNGTRYRIRVGVGAGGTHYAYITYQYTKSTDTAS